jgi:hypothetical protein
LDLKCKTNIINPIHSYLFQQKSLFSFIWKNFDKFNKDIQKLVERYVPYTIRLDEIRNLNYFLKDKNKWILKHINDRE